MPVASIQRHTNARPCPVCGGYLTQGRGQGRRCMGFTSEDGEWCRCSREEYAVGLPLEALTSCFLHHLDGDCNCGVRHDQSPPPAKVQSCVGTNGTGGHIVETYDYRDIDWHLVYQVVRKTDPKDFLQRHPCPDKGGEWVWNLGGNAEKCACPKIDRILYRLPELLAADPNDTVFVVEGEKDVDRLRDLGFVATCNSGGAKKWESHYSEWLRGRDVIIPPDNDTDGHDHGQQVAHFLLGQARSVKVLDLPGLSHKGDVSDWLNQGNTVEELVRLVDQEKEFTPTENNSVYSVYSVYEVEGFNWETPQSFESVEVPGFPVDVFPPNIAEYVRQESVAKQVPEDLAGVLALGTITTAIAGKCRITLTESGDWSEPLNLFYVSVLQSGERKSVAMKDIFAPIEAAEEQLVRDQLPEVIRQQTERDVLDKRLQAMKVKAAKADAPNRVSEEADARELAVELAQFKIPSIPRLMADDATPEAVSGLLAEQGGRIAIVSAEGGIFNLIAGRYSNNVPNLDVFLKGFSGEAYRVDRRSRDPEFIKDPCLTMLLAVQPDVLQELSGNSHFTGRGFTARILYSIPKGNVGYRDINPPPIDAEVRSTWTRAIEFAVGIPCPRDSVPSIELSLGAREAFQTYRAVVEAHLRPSGALDDLANWGSKLCGAVARLAGALHFLVHTHHGSPWDIPLSEETMRNAIRLGDYFAEHAKAAFASMGAKTEMALAKKVWAVIEKGEDQFSVRDLHQSVRRQFDKVAGLMETLGLLAELGYIRELPAPPREGAGKVPSPRYEINPCTRTPCTPYSPDRGAFAPGGNFDHDPVARTQNSSEAEIAGGGAYRF